MPNSKDNSIPSPPPAAAPEAAPATASQESATTDLTPQEIATAPTPTDPEPEPEKPVAETKAPQRETIASDDAASKAPAEPQNSATVDPAVENGDAAEVDLAINREIPTYPQSLTTQKLLVKCEIGFTNYQSACAMIGQALNLSPSIVQVRLCGIAGYSVKRAKEIIGSALDGAKPAVVKMLYADAMVYTQKKNRQVAEMMAKS